jgi:hypothetical protein
MRDGVRIGGNPIARRPPVFNFLPLFTSRCFLAGLNRKLKEKTLCVLCDSSEAGGESIVIVNSKSSSVPDHKAPDYLPV